MSADTSLVDEGDRTDAEVGDGGVAGAGLADDPLPDDSREVARERAARAARGHALEVKADPRDHVVLSVRPGADERVVDREEQVGAVAADQGVLDDRVVPLRAW